METYIKPGTGGIKRDELINESLYKINKAIDDLTISEVGLSISLTETVPGKAADATLVKYLNDKIGAGDTSWKVYKAALSQVGTSDPVARVLNQDDPNYLGDLSWIRSSEGEYRAIIGSPSLIDDKLVLFNIVGGGFINMPLALIDLITIDGFCGIILNTGYYETGDFTLSDEFTNLPIGIMVRQRGSTPSLLEANTDISGGEVILTFSKKMSNYFPNGVSTFTLFNSGSEDMVEIESIAVYDNVITLTLNGSISTINSNDELVLSTGEYHIESIDYGILPIVTNFPVTNNVSVI